MDEIRKQLDALKVRWDATAMRSRVIASVALAALVAGGLLFYAQNSGPRFELLFAGLSADDAGRIVERLRDAHVPYELGEDGDSVLVPAERVHETRLMLATEGLPSGGGVGFEIFDQQRFGESEFTESVQYRRALEGELARTITAIAGVESARVHLVLPERSLFASESSNARASIAVRLRPGFRIRPDQVQGIVHLVASSVRDLDPANVTLVDGDGRPLSESGDEDAATRDSEDLRARIERARERAVQELLDTTLGVGVAAVQVSAEMTFAREERVEESYDPDRVGTRRFQLVTEGGAAGSDGVQGVPGAASALPGGEAAEPVGGSAASGGRHSEVRNFEITKTVTRAVEPVGRVVRLQAAVLVDGNWTVGEDGTRTFAARDAEELERIRGIVRSAVGASAERGDVVTVECVPFAASANPPAVQEASVLAEYEPYFPYGLGLLAIGAALLMFMRLRKPKDDKAGAELGNGETAATLLPAPAMASAAALAQGAAEGDLMAEIEALRRLSVEVSRNEPQVAARVLRAWLVEKEEVPAS